MVKVDYLTQTYSLTNFCLITKLIGLIKFKKSLKKSTINANLHANILLALLNSQVGSVLKALSISITHL